MFYPTLHISKPIKMHIYKKIYNERKNERNRSKRQRQDAINPPGGRRELPKTVK